MIAGLPQILLRRWYATICGLLLTVGLAGAAVILVPVQYQATADVVILPPPSSGPNGSRNPYLELGGLGGVADVLTSTMQSPAKLDALNRKGVKGTFAVSPDLSTSGSLILVTATGKDAAQALATLDTVTADLAPTLLKLQRDISVPKSYLLTTRVVRPETDATVVRKSQTRALIAAVIFGLLATAMLAAAVENLATRRQRARGGPAFPVRSSIDRSRPVQANGVPTAQHTSAGGRVGSTNRAPSSVYRAPRPHRRTRT